MHTDAKRYYAMLGLTPACSEEDIRGAFRRRAKELHPDSESGDATAFIRLKRAYDTLSDPAQRAHYDRASRPRVRRAMRTGFEPLPPRVRPARPGGMSFKRYFVAFLFVGGLSFGAIEAMISYADVPAAAPHPASLLSGATKEAAKDEPRYGERAAAAAPTSLWDPATPGTPTAGDRAPSRRSSSGFGAVPE